MKTLTWKEGKYYIARCLDPELASFGLNKKEAIMNLNEALALYLHEELKTSGEEIVCGRGKTLKSLKSLR